MAAPRNDRERARIYETAVDLFVQDGYSRTTYQAIADACGIRRSKVQYYYPSKDAIVEQFILDDLTSTFAETKNLIDGTDDVFRMFYELGVRHFDFLLDTDRMGVLAEDVISDRSIVHKILAKEVEWALENVNVLQTDEETLRYALIQAMGGAYDLVYYSLQHNHCLNGNDIVQRATLAFLTMLGFDSDAVRARLKELDTLGK